MERKKVLVSLPSFYDDKVNRVRKLDRLWYDDRMQHIFKTRLEQLVPEVRWGYVSPSPITRTCQRHFATTLTQGAHKRQKIVTFDGYR